MISYVHSQGNKRIPNEQSHFMFKERQSEISYQVFNFFLVIIFGTIYKTKITRDIFSNTFFGSLPHAKIPACVK